jgi:molybdate transport system permease protein
MPLSQNDWQVILLTLEVAALAVAGALPLAILAAWALAARFPGRALLHGVVNLPLALPPVVTGWLLLILCGAQGPVGAWLADRFNIRVAFTTRGAALACAVMVFPLMVRTLRLGIEAVDQNVLAAARTLGAGPFDRFFAITLPLAGPGVLLALITGFAASLGQFGAVITFAANIPGQTQTLPLAIYAALQTQGGTADAARLALCSGGLAVLGMLAAEGLAHRLRR